MAPAVNFDVSVALPQMGAFIERIQAALTQRYPDRQHLLFGHLGDGNLHLSSGPYPQPTDFQAVEEIVMPPRRRRWQRRPSTASA
jgi:FAD/FMN-containing dehydrogenase